MRQEITDKVLKMIEKDQEETALRIYNDISNSNGYAFDNGITQKVTSIIAERFVTENYDKIAELIDIKRVCKMAELQAVGKTMNS